MKKLYTGLLLMGIILLAGCWVPEKFEAKVVVNKDGSYTFAYDGILTAGLALMAAHEGKLSAEDEAGLKTEAANIAKQPGFQRVEYLGQGRFKVVVRKTGIPGEPFYFTSKVEKMFAIVPTMDGTLSISGMRLDKDGLVRLKSIGGNIDGTLTVNVERGASVVSHNADSAPSIGLFGGYEWRIKSPNKVPSIVIRPKS